MSLDDVAKTGTRVIEVPDLTEPLIYVCDHDIALIRVGLPADVHRRMTDWLLCQILERHLEP